MNTSQVRDLPVSDVDLGASDASSSSRIDVEDRKIDYLSWSDEEPPFNPNSPHRSIARVWGSRGEYTLDPRWRTWALQRLGVGHLPILIDLFAEP